MDNRPLDKRIDWKVPDRACDCHMHVAGPLARFPYRNTRNFSPPERTWEDYAALMERLGAQRCVVVQPSYYALDNSCVLDAVKQAGGAARAVVVVPQDIKRAELATLREQGVRGIRSQTTVSGGISLDEAQGLVPQLQELGWHLQIYMDDSELPDVAEKLLSFGIPIVLDHMAQVRQRTDHETEGFATLLRLLDTGRVWVKLSSAHFFPDGKRARRLAQVNPERLVWGTDWPHVSYRGEAPDDEQLLNSLGIWFENARLRHRILVENPESLYFSD